MSYLALKLKQLHLDVHLEGLSLVGGKAREIEIHV